MVKHTKYDIDITTPQGCSFESSDVQLKECEDGDLYQVYEVEEDLEEFEKIKKLMIEMCNSCYSCVEGGKFSCFISDKFDKESICELIQKWKKE